MLKRNVTINNISPLIFLEPYGGKFHSYTGYPEAVLPFWWCRVIVWGAGECLHGSCWCRLHSLLPGVECIGKQTGASSRESSESACLSLRVPHHSPLLLQPNKSSCMFPSLKRSLLLHMLNWCNIYSSKYMQRLLHTGSISDTLKKLDTLDVTEDGYTQYNMII